MGLAAGAAAGKGVAGRAGRAQWVGQGGELGRGEPEDMVEGTVEQVGMAGREGTGAEALLRMLRVQTQPQRHHP